MSDRNDQAMSCPVDGAMLVMSDRQGIEIDYCPICRGVWLDRGELDKIIERTGTIAPKAQAAMAEDPWAAGRGYVDDGQRHHRKRRKSFLEELFD
jgi:hypothetical protein